MCNTVSNGLGSPVRGASGTGVDSANSGVMGVGVGVSVGFAEGVEGVVVGVSSSSSSSTGSGALLISILAGSGKDFSGVLLIDSSASLGVSLSRRYGAGSWALP